MSRTYKDSPKGKFEKNAGRRGRRRNISVRAVPRDQPDYRQLARGALRAELERAAREQQAQEQADAS